MRRSLIVYQLLEDQSEKIAAIIVGIIVGIALLIGFFSFIRRAGRGACIFRLYLATFILILHFNSEFT